MSPEEKKIKLDEQRHQELLGKFQTINDVWLPTITNYIDEKNTETIKKIVEILSDHIASDHKRLTRLEERVYIIERELGIESKHKLKLK